MTTHKAFKRLVRARMARTGKRCSPPPAAASSGARRTDALPRPPPIPRSQSRRPGTGCAEGCTRRPRRWPTSSANQGVVSGLTGEPLTEAAIMGIGGGLGAGYILWEFKRHGAPVLTLGFRNRWRYPSTRAEDRHDARPARSRARRARVRRREGGSRGARCTPRWRPGRHRVGRPAGARDLGPARRARGARQLGRRRVRA